MQALNLNQFAQEVHQNAVDHGWWDGDRSRASVRALMHCEISEAEGKRTTCPKCHAKLVEKPGYGTVCAECGWLKKEKKSK